MGLSTKGPITKWERSWAHQIATDKGMRAGYRGDSYDSNPYPRGTPSHLAWSQGHNGARANAALKRDGR